MTKIRTVSTLAAAALVLLYSALAPIGHPRAETEPVQTISVFAAASLKTALDVVAADYQAATGTKVSISYAASSALAKQIEQAAPADVFISADLDWMDYLAEKKLIEPDSRKNLLGNTLVLITPVTSTTTLTIEKNFALADALGAGKLAMADVKAVPAGKYGKAALEALGVWASVDLKVAQAENVRAALALVAREESPFGIVYATDAKAEPKVRVVGTFPEATHPPIVYPVATVAASTHTDAAAPFEAYLGGAQAHARFEAQGFVVPE